MATETTTNNFNWIAPFYDHLTRWVFRGWVQKSQCWFLSLIPEQAHVLILGGGAGWIANAVLQQTKAKKITYIEASERMISLTRQKIKPGDAKKIIYIHGTEKDIPPQAVYDVIITNFYLDLFPEAYLNKVVQLLADSVRGGGYWFYTDFNIGHRKWWGRTGQRITVWGMYLFFKWTSGIEGNRLFHYGELIEKAGFARNWKADFLSGFILSEVCVKKNISTP
ncbi:class I SAM-dependent methyltransferase [Rapidithrix thailandica]|uniref:Class I SAM-dependent methyltransferase n=1 Tax=Rapidithrix thailandica TaxID=413964 RepID=A0AAW9S506_9BACT